MAVREASLDGIQLTDAPDGAERLVAGYGVCLSCGQWPFPVDVLNHPEGRMLSSADRETFALTVMEEVRRWPGIELKPHPSPTVPGESDGIEFRLSGRQVGHVHTSCALHLSLTKALKAWVVSEAMAEPLDAAPASAWAMFNPMSAADAAHAIWLLRLNYVRLRRQRLTPAAAAASTVLVQHEAALCDLKPGVSPLLQRTQARATRRPLPGLEL